MCVVRTIGERKVYWRSNSLHRPQKGRRRDRKRVKVLWRLIGLCELEFEYGIFKSLKGNKLQ